MSVLPRLHSTTYKLHRFGFSSLFRVDPLSSIARSYKSKKPLETNVKKQTESSTIASLFNEITEILGADNFIADRNSYGFLISAENYGRDDVVSEKSLPCAPTVCGNGEESLLQEKDDTLILGDTQLGVIDVSPVVHEVTQIIRAENGLVSMEDRLEKLGFELNPEIVGKVLKRCFKVPHLALRFFNWMKLKDGFDHTLETYNTMLYIAGEAKEFGLMETLVEEMGEVSCHMDLKTWTILISHYGKAKRIGKALLVYNKMIKTGHEPDEVVYKMMIRSLCVAGKADIAIEFYKEIVKKEIELDLSLYKMLLSCLARSGDTAGVHLVAEDMMKISQIPDQIVYGCVLKSFCLSGRIRDALEYIRDLKDKEVTFGREYFETLVKGLCRANRIGDALEIFEIMKMKQLVDEKVYGVIINGYLRVNDISKALDVFQSMKESGYCPTTSTYTELMQHLFRLNQYEKGCRLYDEMLNVGLQPDSVAITAMVAGHVRENRISEAWKAFESMEDKGISPTWKSYSIFIKELCRISSTDEVLKVLNKMQASEIVIGDEIFQCVISHMERKGERNNIEKVKQIQGTCKVDAESKKSTDDTSVEWGANMDLIHKTEPKIADLYRLEPLSKVYNERDLEEICRILSLSLDWSLIQETLEKSTVKLTPELVVEVLRNCNTNGYAAFQFFSWVGKQADYNHTAETYNMAIKLAGRGKDFRHMKSLFYEMRRKGYAVTSDTWTITIMLYGRIGLTEIALNTFAEMKANNCNPTANTYKYLIISLCGRKGRKVIEAIQLFNAMIRDGHIPDKELVESYLACLCEVDKLLEARKCVDSLHKAGFTVALSYSLYIRALCRAGKIEEALAMVDEMGTDRATLDQFTYGSIFHGLLRKGRVEEALEKMGSMKQAGVNPTVHVYTSLIVHFLKEKHIEKALETLGKMREEGCEPTIVTYSAFIRGYIASGNVCEAWNVFYLLKLKGPSPDFKTYSMFIDCLCKVGKSEEALRLLDEMLSSGIVPSTVNFRTIFYGLNREGKQSLAQTVVQQKQALIRSRKLMT
ncbi:putative pentatricopeptide repeat-containing protein At5g06400, mitochondrial [Cannabis sativa]|uniref:putative pentatricopeptide repeat-containing protein At5g06400, mitochondrial n=1 Tax=Cannabis sativa TaxID=3483 RepID=UPI0029CA8EE4|nr:putative pentatricopeptide repeat-containing protein At5g06400, mitochondrial [Cannabis sativa]